MNKWESFKAEYYGGEVIAATEWGLIDFCPESMKKVVGGEKLSYYEYLEIQKISGKKNRRYFEMCYYDSVWNFFKGKIERKRKGKICFERIFVSGMYDDGIGFDGKEDHVWIDAADFEECEVGDCFSFSADVYKYLKTGKGKMIDYALRNPIDIKKIGEYELPSDEELRLQSIDLLICEVCMFNEHCNMDICVADENWINSMRTFLLEVGNIFDEAE